MMNEHLNVLLIHNKYRLAGGEDTLAVNDAAMLTEHGHRVTEYIKDNSDIDGFSKWDKLMAPFRMVYSFKQSRELKRIIRENNIDIIYAINLVPLIGFTVYRVAHAAGVPIVQSVNNFRYVCPGSSCIREGHICESCITNKSFSDALKYGCYRNSKLQTVVLCTAMKIHRWLGSFDLVDCYTVPSRFNKSKLNAIVKNEDKVVVLNPTIPDETKEITDARDRKYYVYAARLEKLKGIDIAVKAFEKLDFPLKVLGTGNMEEEMKRYAAEHELKGITFEGFCDRDRMREIFAGAKALLYPTQWYEGIPLTLLESFSLGTPVIGSNIGNVGDCVSDGVNGITFQYDDPDSLAGAVRQLENPEELERLITGARQVYEDNYSPESYYNNLMAIFEKVIEKRTGTKQSRHTVNSPDMR